MRNLTQYPITKAEKLKALSRAAELMAADLDRCVGGVELAALQVVRQQVEAEPE